MTKKKKKKSAKYEIGSSMCVYLNKDVSPELLKWINNQNVLGSNVIDILEKYVSGEYVQASILSKYMQPTDEQLADNEGSNTESNQINYKSEKCIPEINVEEVEDKKADTLSDENTDTSYPEDIFDKDTDEISFY